MSINITLSGGVSVQAYTKLFTIFLNFMRTTYDLSKTKSLIDSEAFISGKSNFEKTMAAGADMRDAEIM